MDIDPRKEVQRLRLGGETYVLVREETYERLLRRLDGLHASLQLQRKRAGVSRDLVDVLVAEKLSPEQVRGILRARSFGERLAILRLSRGLDQAEVAYRAGLSQTLVSNFENNKVRRPSYDAIQRILGALGLPDIASYVLLRKEPVSTARSRELAPV